MKALIKATVRHLLKFILITVSVVALSIMGVHIWFKHNARTALKDYIKEQSDGKIKLELSELDLNLFSNTLQIHEADLVSIDSLHEPITYHVTFSKLSLRVASIWPVLFKKQLLLDSIKLHNPVIEIMQWRRDTLQSTTKDELSIPQEMGKVYRSMANALDEFDIKRILIDNATFRLINKMKPASQPVTVSNIFFDLARPGTGNKNSGDSIGEQKIALRTTNQDIMLPGGRHKLAFKAFNLQLLRQRIELDSCTITALPTDSTRSNYKIFFKKLFLSGVDFAAMSTQNVIKADSVYCENPDFNFDIYKSAIAKKTALPDAQKIVRELSGNLDLAYVGIKNAGIHIDIYGKTKRSFFNSNKDNFEMTGFRINPDAAEPVAIKRFEMTLRDYHLYNEDSSSVFAFDSLHLLNSKIVLNNFSIESGSGLNKIRSLIDVKVPYFELSEMDWYQLIFDQNLVAKEAFLESPVINFKRNIRAAQGKKVNLFSALENIDVLVALDKVSVQNGQVNMQLSTATSFNVQDLDFNLQSNQLLGSSNRRELSRSIQDLSFSNGILRLQEVTVRMQNARYSPNNQINSDRVSIFSKNNSIEGTVNGVHVNNLLIDEVEESIELDGIDWTSASINLKSLPNSGSKNNENSMYFRNIAGNNTMLTYTSGPTAISTFVQTIHASSFRKNPNKPLVVEDFSMLGDDLLIKNKNVKIGIDKYQLLGNESSYLRGIVVEQYRGRDSLQILSPEIKFTTNLNDVFANDLHLANVHATAPVVRINQYDTSVAIPDTTAQPLAIRIDKLTTTEPDIHVALNRNDSVSVINIPFSNNSYVNASGINISSDGLHLETIQVNTTGATYTKASGEKIGTEKGNIEIDVSNLHFGNKEGRKNWYGLINKFNVQDAGGLQFGKSKSNLKFNQAFLGNLNLSSDYLPDFGQFMKANLSAWLRIPAGEYIDSNTTFKWYNAEYSNTNRTLSLDSLYFHPTLPLDSALAYAPYQFDYITVKTGAVNIAGLNAEQYERDSSFIADSVTISSPVLTVYRDKLPPSSPNKTEKLLPAAMIKNISLPISVNSVRITDGTITYGEKNAKSREEGTLVLSKLEGQLQNIKNTNLKEEDSLSLSLAGYLMDSAYLDIALKQSFTDSLGGFIIDLKIEATPLNILNPVTVPLSNIKLTSGRLDSLTMHAVGRDDLALGEMNMHYKDLRIKLIKNGNPNESTFTQNILSFLANTFIIKNKNTKRTGVVYFNKSSTQSFVNYILKMSLSGMASSVGLKSNRKYMKLYKKELAESKLPPVQ
jgi:hypothetical protein